MNLYLECNDPELDEPPHQLPGKYGCNVTKYCVDVTGTPFNCPVGGWIEELNLDLDAYLNLISLELGYYSIDHGSNTETPIKTTTLQIDTTAPTIEITFPLVNADSGAIIYTNQQVITVQGYVRDIQSGVYEATLYVMNKDLDQIYFQTDLVLSGGSTKTFSQPINLHAGKNKIYVVAKDNAMNKARAPTQSNYLDVIYLTSNGVSIVESGPSGYISGPGEPTISVETDLMAECTINSIYFRDYINWGPLQLLSFVPGSSTPSTANMLTTDGETHTLQIGIVSGLTLDDLPDKHQFIVNITCDPLGIDLLSDNVEFNFITWYGGANIVEIGAT